MGQDARPLIDHTVEVPVEVKEVFEEWAIGTCDDRLLVKRLLDASHPVLFELTIPLDGGGVQTRLLPSSSFIAIYEETHLSFESFRREVINPFVSLCSDTPRKQFEYCPFRPLVLCCLGILVDTRQQRIEVVIREIDPILLHVWPDLVQLQPPEGGRTKERELLLGSLKLRPPGIEDTALLFFGSLHHETNRHARLDAKHVVLGS